MDVLPPSLQNKLHYLPSNGKELHRLGQAYAMAEAAHEGMMRKSGEPFISHPVAVAEILAEMHLDCDALIAGLLHDTVEDTDVTFEQIETCFGADVRCIVEGETKISKLAVRVYKDEQSENLRQMLLAMVKDVRVILVKLADRLHNMRTLASMPEHKQKKIAKETLEIFAPLAHRLGINHIKSELEDLSFYYLEPEGYQSLQRQVRMRQNERDQYVQSSIKLLSARLEQEGLYFEISGRSKHLYSVYRKMERDAKGIDQIFDLMAIRAIIETDTSANGSMSSKEQQAAVCYRALGLVHSLWTPIPGRFKDYVAVPKLNGYQSLHTTVIGHKGQPIEVQLRTRQMHEIAEYGVAAHWAYKQGLQDVQEVQKRVSWMKQLLDVDKNENSAKDFVDTVRQDFLSERVVVFTPQGDTINLPRGSTPIDFAYHVHTEVGHRCIGARVNGNIVALSYKLHNGDRVEVLTNRNPQYGPSSGWLDIAITRSAKQKIRQYFRHQERQGLLETSRRSLERAMRRKHLPVNQLMSKHKLEEAAKLLTQSDSVEELLLALNSKRLTNKQVIEVLAPETIPAPTPAKAKSNAKHGTGGIYLDGLAAPAKLARCCSPVRGDDVLGYITRGNGVSVHRLDCPNARKLMQKDSERIVNVTWDAPSGEVYPVDFEVIAVDRPRLLADVLDVIGEMQKSASRVGADVHDNSKARMYFRVDVKDNREIQHIKERVMKIPDVTDVYRSKPGLKS